MTHTETGETHFTVQRTFGAPPEHVYRAFTDPDELETWYTEGDAVPEVHEVELEASGTLSISHRDGDNNYRHEGTYVEVVENERLVHTMRWVDGPPEMESLVTVEFRDVDGGTEVEYTQEELPSEHVGHGARVMTELFENLNEVL